MNHPGTNVHNIILIGFMGCGKSTIGRELKRMMDFQWIDTDTEIETRAQCRITEIFTRDGEDAFREMESQVLRDLLEKNLQSTIVSTGGGAILREENRRLMQNLGYVVWLRAGSETIYQRTKKNRQRPILQTENPRALIEELLTLREPLYRECAHLIIDVAGLNRTEISAGIVESARYFFAHKSQ